MLKIFSANQKTALKYRWINEQYENKNDRQNNNNKWFHSFASNNVMFGMVWSSIHLVAVCDRYSEEECILYCAYFHILRSFLITMCFVQSVRITYIISSSAKIHSKIHIFFYFFISFRLISTHQLSTVSIVYSLGIYHKYIYHNYNQIKKIIHDWMTTTDDIAYRIIYMKWMLNVHKLR